MNASRSYQRSLVDEALAAQGSDLGAFVEAAKAQGKSIEEMWLELRRISGVAFTSRTFYRWIEGLEVRAS